MHLKLSIQKWEYPGDGTFHSAHVYKVIGLPAEQQAYLELKFGRGWQIQRRTKGTPGAWHGEYRSADDAIAALRGEIDAESAKPE